MHEGVALLVTDLQRFLVGIVIAAVHQTDLGAVSLGGLHLGDRSAVGQADQRGNTALGGGQCHALGVVAGRTGDDAPGLFLVGQVGDLITRTAQLERTGVLQVLRLEEQFTLGGNTVGAHQLGLADDGLQSDGRLKDFIKGQHNGFLQKGVCALRYNNV